ncbi:hypothetical protein VNO80_19162 [Phaseolus coccineus]|uniref:Uncharacterized protein n=1 Tax=Phaseolus coccineus TaxID=3886 RepID=A0AAN9MGT2_PHACN
MCWCWVSPPARSSGAGRRPRRSSGAGRRPVDLLGVAPVICWCCVLPRRSSGHRPQAICWTSPPAPFHHSLCYDPPDISVASPFPSSIVSPEFARLSSSISPFPTTISHYLSPSLINFLTLIIVISSSSSYIS